ncbi:MAG TPA: HAD-IIB family hydrolase [Geothermobacteraceae bacterium]|nr:HAD-IIB family hydrolase [Geothermobacteraceae bacterium]
MRLKLLIYSDLDGTLLDHDSYSWQPAAAALARLVELEIPLILNSSKTAREIQALRQGLNNHHPYIVENGCAICVPGGYFPAGSTSTETGSVEIKYFGQRYDLILQTLRTLRQQNRYPFSGFADFGIDGICKHTGLERQAAEQAGQRLGSEPLLWQGSEEDLQAFSRDLTKAGLQLVKGGRFLHVMGSCDKGRAMQWLTERYRNSDPARPLLTVALGDGNNDLPMLRSADIAVVIKPKHGPALQLEQHHDVIYPEAPGPAGWQEALDQVLDRLR